MARIDWASSLKLAKKLFDALAKLAIGDETELWVSYKGHKFLITIKREE